MSNAVLILGNSGTGKSTSIRTLPPEETFIINVLGKPLPFRGAHKKYVEANKDNPQGNTFATDKSSTIVSLIDKIDRNRPEIRYLIIDDFGYLVTKEYMSKALQNGYAKFSEMAVSTWNVLDKVMQVRPDLTCFLMMHSDIKEDGVAKPKTIGKMLDEKVCIEGLFSHVLHSVVQDGKYYFQTNHEGTRMAKMPLDMFENLYIPNDLLLVSNALRNYYNADIDM